MNKKTRISNSAILCGRDFFTKKVHMNNIFKPDDKIPNSMTVNK